MNSEKTQSFIYIYMYIFIQMYPFSPLKGFPGNASSKELTFQCKRYKRQGHNCRGPAPVDPGNSKVGTASASLEITYLITDREGLED